MNVFYERIYIWYTQSSSIPSISKKKKEEGNKNTTRQRINTPGKPCHHANIVFTHTPPSMMNEWFKIRLKA